MQFDESVLFVTINLRTIQYPSNCRMVVFRCLIMSSNDSSKFLIQIYKI